MKLIKAREATNEPASGALYVNGEIGFALLAGAPATEQVEVYRVDFNAGARNRVHIHKHDQILIAVSGRGIVADADGEHIMEPGDTVTIPAGHPHWHGATQDHDFSHFTVALPGDEIEIVDQDARGDWGGIPEEGGV